MLVGSFCLWMAFIYREVVFVGGFHLWVVVGQGSGSVFTVGGMFGDGVSHVRGWLLLGRVGRVIGVGQCFLGWGLVVGDAGRMWVVSRPLWAGVIRGVWLVFVYGRWLSFVGVEMLMVGAGAFVL